jgi:uncharacterized membrane protein YgcG
MVIQLRHRLFVVTALMASILLARCNKHADAPAPPQIEEQFFALPPNARPELKTLVASLQRENAADPFVKKVVAANGFPQWDRVQFLKEPPAAATRTTGAESWAYLIPFKDKARNAVTAYLAVLQNRDSAWYRLINKDRYYEQAKTERDPARLKILMRDLSVFGFLEKREYGRDTLSLPGTAQSKLYNVQVTRQATPPNGRASEIVCTDQYTTCWWYEYGDGSYARTNSGEYYCVTIFTGCYDDNQTVEFFGGGGGTGGGGTGGNGDPWGGGPNNDPGGGGSGGSTGATGDVSAEGDPNFPQYDPDAAYWNVVPNPFPAASLPSYADFNASYPKSIYGGEMAAADVYALVGGPILDLYNSDPAKYGNACALRVSRALNYSGVTIPSIFNETYQGGDGKFYFLSAAKLYAWMMRTFGTANAIVVDKSQGGTNGSNFLSHLYGNQGVYIMQASYPGQFRATGHATIFTGTSCLGNCYFDAKGGVEKVVLWKLN